MGEGEEELIPISDLGIEPNPFYNTIMVKKGYDEGPKNGKK